MNTMLIARGDVHSSPPIQTTKKAFCLESLFVTIKKIEQIQRVAGLLD